ncbi:FtsX-like permease family protein [Haloferax sp. MBLA0076]|uniref:FtsX-like permease family protein n=1 Tax=Haloferax litoreum TaxID=2666140 RepID=A0A6A8GKB2_9EURY|nr:MULTISPECIES: ABC transporter permease [Haloferax]KAB1189966.1 ABC transporter permease [Haloferax sp. CBA1148]MRX23738.1 FtsX-like permease family protein [Haloferax litoreum]
MSRLTDTLVGVGSNPEGVLASVYLARRNLARNSLRSTLAILGIIIGVFAIATLGILGSVIQLTAADALGGLGDQVIVSPNADAGIERLTDRDVTTITRAVGEDATVIPVVTGGALVERGEARTFAALYAVERPGDLFAAESGELPERHRRGAIVGSGVADELDVEVGRTITIEGREYRVVAVLGESDGFNLLQPDGAVLIPRTAFADESYTQVIVRAESGSQAATAADAIRASVNAREERVSILELSRIVDRIDQFFGLLNAFLIAIGAVSLVVAGVSILNVMLMSVSERRGEIGVLRAVGVQRRDVLRTVLVEAGLLGFVGGVVGAVISGLVALGLYLAVPEVTLPVVVNPRTAGYLVFAVLFGIVISLASGLYPAWRAANERPVEALRVK